MPDGYDRCDPCLKTDYGLRSQDRSMPECAHDLDSYYVEHVVLETIRKAERRFYEKIVKDLSGIFADEHLPEELD